MNDSIVLPTYLDEELAKLSPFELTDIIIEDCDRVPLNVIDECARRGDEMTGHLSILHHDDFLWDTESGAGVWWLRLHAPMILGLIPSEQAGLLLVELMRRMSLEDEYQQDWLAGYWSALFKNKPDSVLIALRALCEDRDMDWYIRANAIESLMDAIQRQGGAAFEQVLAWLANIVADETQDWDLRLLAGNDLLEYRRPEYRTLLEDLADKQIGLGKMFDRDDVQRTYADTTPKRDRFANPWQFYEPEAITERQIRWREEDTKASQRRLHGSADYLDELYDPDDPYFPEEPYVRPEPKVGRNDPCPCGSGKKYKKCCTAKE